MLALKNHVLLTGHASRFSNRFRQIVRDEQGGNFITQLHRGQLAIMPWPVIQSAEFYQIMSSLGHRLNEQICTHGNGLMFLQTLKALMAKLKANDWGALDRA